MSNQTGRKPIYKEAMTPAERARRYRQERKRRQVLAIRDPATAPLMALFDELHECVRLGAVDEARTLADELVARALQVRNGANE